MPNDGNETTRGQEKEALVKKRLLLAKMMYERGRDDSEKPDALSKMLAMHHFHNAVEITLKCIFNEFQVESKENLRRLGFEKLWDEIDRHLKKMESNEDGSGLPQRDYMMVLNDQRNLVQHAASEPSSAVLMESNVNTKNFLVEVFRKYFEEDYEKLNARSLIQSKEIREALDIAAEYLAQGSVTPEDCLDSVTICKLVYEGVRSEVERHITGAQLNPFFEVSSKLRDYRDIGTPLVKLMDRTNEICKWVTMFASGVDLAESKRFDRLTPIIHFVLGGGFCAQIWPESQSRIGKEEARWVLSFTTDVLIKWQSLGFAMEWPPRRALCLEKIKAKAIKVDVIQTGLRPVEKPKDQSE